MISFADYEALRRPRARGPRPPRQGHAHGAARRRHRACRGAQPDDQRRRLPLYDYARKAIADGLPDGPFRGVPYLLKDLTSALAGVRMTRGSRFFADTPPAAADSEHVARLKRAGLVVFGRTNTCELGLSLTCEPQLYGPTSNPWDSPASRAARAAARPRPSARGCCRWRTRPTASARSARRRPAAAWSASSPRAAGTPWRPTPAKGSADSRPSTPSRSPCATPRRCSTRPRARARAIPMPPRRPPRRFARGRRQPGAPHRVDGRGAERRARRADSLRALSRDGALCADLGHHVEERDPEIDGAAVVPTFLTSRRQHGREPRRVIRRGRARRARRGRAHHVLTGSWARRSPPPTTSAPPRPPIGSVARWPPSTRVGRAAHAGSRPPAGEARLDRHDDGRRRRVLAARVHVLAIHRVVQHHGPARDDAAARPKRGGLPLAVQLVARFGDEATLFRLRRSSSRAPLVRPQAAARRKDGLATPPAGHGCRARQSA